MKHLPTAEAPRAGAAPTLAAALALGAALLLLALWLAWPGAAGAAVNTTPPAAPVKLVFIHHSTGEAWLADDHGGLGLALRDNHYFVSDTNYGWGPDGIGDNTDIGQWWTWFRGPDAPLFTAALYAESGQNCGYSRLEGDPGGANEIVVFKSCFPNSDLSGSATGTPPPIADNPLRGQAAGGRDFTVANAKGIYKDLLTYFAAHQEKLFVCVAAPPVQSPQVPANGRALADWLVDDWLAGYAHDNVFVFDLYNVLTSRTGGRVSDVGLASGNHHRIWKGAVQHKTNEGVNYLRYPTSGGDDHPSAAGDGKATAELLPLLNNAYNAWRGNAPRVPTVTSFLPTLGMVGSGVSLTGSGFTGATTVAFHGTPASFSVVSGTRITATVPAGATTGTIAVTTPAGTGTSAASFAVSGQGLTINVTAPAGSTSYVVGANLTVTWTTSSVASSGQFGVWARSPAGGWYIGRTVAAGGGASYSTSLTLDVPAASGYQAIVAWRATAGSAWTVFGTSPGSFAVTVPTDPDPVARLAPADLVYAGAFRLPGASGGSSWGWSGDGLTFCPTGDAGGGADGYPGSLYGIGHDWQHFVSEVDIPAPVISADKDPADLPAARTLQPFADVRGALFPDLGDEMLRADLEYVPSGGGHAQGRLFLSWGRHMQLGAANATHMWCALDLADPRPVGPWSVGGYEDYVTCDYLFSVDPAWAAANAPGKLLATGRYRGGGQGGMGPSIFLFAPSAADAAPPGGTLPAVPLLLYDNVWTGGTDVLNEYQHSDEWSGAAWLSAGGRGAVVVAGTKGTGACWYGFADGTAWPDEPPYPPVPPGGERGWWSTGFSGELLFYDPADLAATAAGTLAVDEPQPYAVLPLNEYLFAVHSGQQKDQVGAIAFDRAHGLLYVMEPLADGDNSIVHVWSLR